MIATGPEFHEEHVLRDGTHVVLRHIRPDDGEQLMRGFAKLSSESRFLRFLGGVKNLRPEQVRYLTNVDGVDHVAIVAATGSPEVGLGVGRFIRSHDEPQIAEAALTVIDEAQHRGIGTLLGLALARAAKERGITHFRGEVLAENTPVRELLAEAGATVRGSDDGTVEFEVALEPFGEDSSMLARLRKLLRTLAGFVTRR